MRILPALFLALLCCGATAVADGLVQPTYGSPKYAMDVWNRPPDPGYNRDVAYGNTNPAPRFVWWRVILGEVYIVENDPNSASTDAKGNTVYTRYIITMGWASMVVPVDSISLIPPTNPDYEKAAKIYAEDAKQANESRQAQADRAAADRRAAAQAADQEKRMGEMVQSYNGAGN